MLPLRRSLTLPVPGLAAAAGLVLGLAFASAEPARAGHRGAYQSVHSGHHTIGGLYRGHGRPYGFRGHHRIHLAGHRYGYWHDHAHGAQRHWLRHGGGHRYGWLHARRRILLYDGAHHHHEHAHGHPRDCDARYDED